MATALITTTWSMPIHAGLFDGPVDSLPVLERVALREGKTVVTGENGKYIARTLVNASPEVVWAVLTDYENSTQYLPNLVSSKVLETNQHGKVVEQVSERQIFVVTIRSRIRFATKETDKQRIDFRLVEGDLAKMQGYWKLEPVAPYPGAKPNQVLITTQVEAEPAAGTPTDIFYDIYKSALKDTMNAIRQEVGRRS
ncbi:SRPBCC family protein [Leptolyngbya sp. 'hensonii']|uniref:SRPBCC family protein n=1 Tax=Leptolyngbya sp. 'hensonii' TaxID=1922337 RepID=UPI001C0DEAD4|nr:SRPBCC family protein [Leptolyngbya sp. 'hensonii']